MQGCVSTVGDGSWPRLPGKRGTKGGVGRRRMKCGAKPAPKPARTYWRGLGFKAIRHNEEQSDVFWFCFYFFPLAVAA